MLYLKGMRRMMFQLSGFCCKSSELSVLAGKDFGFRIFCPGRGDAD